MKNNKSNEATITDRNRQAIAGIKKHFANTGALALDGAAPAPGDVIAALQGVNDAVDRASAAAAAFHDAVASKRAAIDQGTVLLGSLRAFVQSQLGSAHESLGDFGFANPSRGDPDEATKAAAVLKRAATRKARHTMGKRQKALIKGPPDVPAPTMTATPPPAKPR